MQNKFGNNIKPLYICNTIANKTATNIVKKIINQKVNSIMTQQEFFERTNIELNAEAYAEVERIYMAAGDDMDKDTFCRLYKRLNTSGYDLALALATAVEAEHAKTGKANETIAAKVLAEFDMAEFLIGKAHAYNDTDFRKQAVRLVSEREVVMITLRLGLPLFEEDTKYISEHLN